MDTNVAPRRLSELLSKNTSTLSFLIGMVMHLVADGTSEHHTCLVSSSEPNPDVQHVVIVRLASERQDPVTDVDPLKTLHIKGEGAAKVTMIGQGQTRVKLAAFDRHKDGILIRVHRIAADTREVKWQHRLDAGPQPRLLWFSATPTTYRGRTYRHPSVSVSNMRDAETGFCGVHGQDLGAVGEGPRINMICHDADKQGRGSRLWCGVRVGVATRQEQVL